MSTPVEAKPVLKPPELTAPQYAILAEAQRKKRALAETRIKYNDLVEENTRLLEEREQSEKMTYEVRLPPHHQLKGGVCCQIQHARFLIKWTILIASLCIQVTESMRRDIFTKNEKIGELQAALSDQAASFDIQMQTQCAALEDKLTQEQRAAQETEEKLREEVEGLTKELLELDKFTQEKGDLERSRLRMRAETDELKCKCEEVAQEEERRYIQGTVALQKSYDQKCEKLKKRHAVVV
jgi:hypothetical protein